jgi:hypothetical protein
MDGGWLGIVTIRLTQFKFKFNLPTGTELGKIITVLIEATTFAMQPVCNAAWAANALHSNQ